ncbi:MAG: ATP-binding cassette domain-containing protein, partial [Clostridiales bacterium]|nr:ATP-binding cassette domain-containing protein [Clostridiales bacterium]
MKIKMKGIYKSFGADNVLTNVDFSVSEGETVALLGESGAGKSTLMSILGGAESADKGEITIDGAPLRFRSPADAIKAGIFAVYHDLDPVSDLKVYEYIFLGREISTYGILRNRSMKTETACVLGKIAPEIDPGALLSGLSKVDRRIVGICRAFLSGASVIILDEAMKSLAEEPVQRILKMFLSMGCNGTAVVFVSNNFVSNNMKDPLNICSRFVIMRDGTVAGEYAREHVNADMIRRRLRSDSGISYSKGSRFVSRYCVLKVSSSDCSFYVNRGEVLGITGSGLSELFMPAAGVGKPLSGKIYLHGKAIRVKDPASAIKLGIAFAPRDRRKNGIFPDMNTM